jgi:hypothetical protein
VTTRDQNVVSLTASKDWKPPATIRRPNNADETKREGSCHEGASGVGRVDRAEHGKGKRQASTSQRSGGTLISGRGSANRAIVGRARTRMAETSDRWRSKLRRCGARGSRASAAAGRSLATGLLAKPSEQPVTTPHVDKVIAEARVPLCEVE